MDDIDFLPEAYRKKCQQRHWIMRRVQISVLVACIMIIFIGYDQHSIRRLRLQVLPRLQHQLATLESSKLRHDNVQKQLRESTFEREKLFLPLLRVSRSRLVGEVLHRLPPEVSLNTLSLVTQPEIWVGSPIGIPKDTEPLRFELNRLVEIARSSELKLSLAGSAPSMEQINQYAKQLNGTRLFSNIKLQETRKNGDRFEFNFLAVVVNPYAHRTQDAKSNENADTLTAFELTPRPANVSGPTSTWIKKASFVPLKPRNPTDLQVQQ